MKLLIVFLQRENKTIGTAQQASSFSYFLHVAIKIFMSPSSDSKLVLKAFLNLSVKVRSDSNLTLLAQITVVPGWQKCFMVARSSSKKSWWQTTSAASTQSYRWTDEGWVLPRSQPQVRTATWGTWLQHLLVFLITLALRLLSTSGKSVAVTEAPEEAERHHHQ